MRKLLHSRATVNNGKTELKAVSEKKVMDSIAEDLVFESKEKLKAAEAKSKAKKQIITLDVYEDKGEIKKPVKKSDK